MSTTTITGTVLTPNLLPRFGVLVRAFEVFGSVGIDDDDGNVVAARTSTDKDGNWSLSLTPNSELYPLGSWYRIRIGDRVVTKIIPTGGPYDIEDPLLAFNPSLGVALVADFADYQPLAGKNVVSGYAGLDTTGTVAVAQVPAQARNFFLNFYDFGAVGDGAADDTAAVQAAFNSVTYGVGVPALTLHCSPGTFLITDTLLVHRKALILFGAGNGNTTVYAPNEGAGTTFQWGGSAGGHLFQLVDCQNVVLQDIQFQGNTSAVPASLVRLYNDGASSAGTNSYVSVIRCRFGRAIWSNVTTAVLTTAATAGILVDGTNLNNDQFLFADCQFDECATGIDLPNSQSIWGLIENCFFNNATVAGVRTSASLTLVNAQFNACAIDVQCNSTAKVVTFGHWSENSGKFVDVTSYGQYAAYGGKWLFGANLGANYVTCTGSLTFENIELSVGAYTGKFLYMHEAASGEGTLVVRGGSGLLRSHLDVQAAAGGYVKVLIDSADVSYNRILRSSQNLLTSTRASVVGAKGLSTPLHHGYAAEAFDATTVGTGVIVPTAGTVYGIKLWLPTAESISELRLWVVTAGATLTASQNLAGLYSGAGALLATSADQSTAWTATGECTMAITAQAQSAGPVFLCFFANGTTLPTFLALNTGTGNRGLAAADSFFFRTADTGRTTSLPATLGAFTALTQAYWGAVK